VSLLRPLSLFLRAKTISMFFAAICDCSAQPIVFQVPSGEITVLGNCIPPSQPAAALPRDSDNRAPLCFIKWSPCGNFIAASCGMNCIAMYANGIKHV
jgi:hypothetical protein